MSASCALSIPAKSFTNLGGFGLAGIFCEKTLSTETTQNKTERVSKYKLLFIIIVIPLLFIE
jgi:hypothetical protein